MQLVAIAVWGWNGLEPRVVQLQPGKLNVITGDSKTGKSALLDIVDYCFGRDEETVAGERIREAVEWYGISLKVDASYLFLGRPRPKKGAATSDQALVLEGTSGRLPGREQLHPNVDRAGLRRRVGQLLRIGEYRAPTDEDALASGNVASAGQAVLLCLQKQGEVSAQDLLFHRQGERRVAEGLRDTLPYFLGAEPFNQAVLQVQARDARRVVEVTRNRVRAAETRDVTVEGELRALVEEAYAVGLLPSREIVSRPQAMEDLRAATTRDLVRVPGRDAESPVQDRRTALQSEQAALRRELRSLIAERAALEGLIRDEQSFGAAVSRQQDALTSLGLVGQDRDTHSCPLCGNGLAEPDATVTEMREFAQQLNDELAGLTSYQPRRAAAFARIEGQISAVRTSLDATNLALTALAPDTQLVLQTRDEELAFHRGRIDASLSALAPGTGDNLDRARQAAEVAQRRLAQLAELLDGTTSDLGARLVTIGQYATAMARALDVEHSDRPVTLDIKNLTAIVTTATGRLRLKEVGSASNYLGLHLAVHLALHRFLTEEDRPVPRFLMLDQPSQPFYPEDVTKKEADGAELPRADSDRTAVVSMYKLLWEYVQDQNGKFQVVVSDHVNLREEPWFQDSIVETWRDGHGLIPADWPARPAP